MASGHVNRTKRPNTWLHRPTLQNVKKALANPEPSTHGTKRTCRALSDHARSLGQTGSGRPEAEPTTVLIAETSDWPAGNAILPDPALPEGRSSPIRCPS